MAPRAGARARCPCSAVARSHEPSLVQHTDWRGIVGFSVESRSVVHRVVAKRIDGGRRLPEPREAVLASMCTYGRELHSFALISSLHARVAVLQISAGIWRGGDVTQRSHAVLHKAAVY